MKGRLGFMANPTTRSCEECPREVFYRLLPKKDFIEELDVLSTDKYFTTFVFNGSYRMTNSAFFVGNKVVTKHLCKYGNYINAISETNKRHLMSLEISTDYITPNPLIVIALGFDAEGAQLLTYIHDTDEFPIRMKVTGYDNDTGEKFETASVVALAFSGSEKAISDDEAISLITDYLLDNELVFNSIDLINEFGTLEKANKSIILSQASKVFGENACEDEWEQLEYALAYEMASEFFKSAAFIALQAYGFIHDRYEVSDFILAETTFTFGINAENAICITGEVATMNNSFIVNKLDFAETNQFVQPHTVTLLEYLAQHGEDAEIPDEILDDIADNCFYITEALCGDLEFELHMKEITPYTDEVLAQEFSVIDA